MIISINWVRCKHQLKQDDGVGDHQHHHDQFIIITVRAHFIITITLVSDVGVDRGYGGGGEGVRWGAVCSMSTSYPIEIDCLEIDVSEGRCHNIQKQR